MTRDRLSRSLSLGSLVVAALVAAAAPLRAQSTGTLQGAIKNTATAAERSVVTNNAGEYVAASLQPGHYEVLAHIEGFADQKREVDLGPAETIAVNLKLNPGTIAENVTVI